MKNFRKELVINEQEFQDIRQEVLNSNVVWGDPRTWGTHTGQRALYLYEIFPIYEGDPFKKHKINPYIIKGEICQNFPKTVSFLENFAKKRGELSRIVLFNLKEGSEFLPHRDLGEYYKIRDRYHLIVVSGGSYMSSGDEECIFHEGEVWWFNNKELHNGRNLSQEKPRIHIVFDILPEGAETTKQKIKRKFLNNLLIVRYKLGKKYLYKI